MGPRGSRRPGARGADRRAAGAEAAAEPVFAAARFAGIEPVPDEHITQQMRERWPEIRDLALARRTQTNESARSAVLLPLLAQLPQPLALLEVGASAGLCLYPDRFSYQYGDVRIDPEDGPGPLVPCAISGPVPVPTVVPRVVWRAGIDLNPLDVTSADDMRWLDPAGRAAFVAAVTGSRARWISNEAPQVLGLPVPGDRAPDPSAEFVVALDGTPVAIAAPHGQALHWLS